MLRFCRDQSLSPSPRYNALSGGSSCDELEYGVAGAMPRMLVPVQELGVSVE